MVSCRNKSRLTSSISFHVILNRQNEKSNNAEQNGKEEGVMRVMVRVGLRM
jgi:hypothetical protein